ncbi:OmpW/AlkL family protein [Endozoicomonadaceae bacterium StTr2]
MKRISSAAILSIVVALGIAGPAVAYKGGDSIIRFGASYMSPTDDTYTLKTSPQTKVKYKQKENTQFGFDFTHMLNDNFGLEVALNTQFKHTVKDKNTSKDAFEYKHMPLILGGQWFPMGGKNPFQPYLSLGMHYDWFDSAKSKNTSAIKKVSFDDCWGWNAGAGFDWLVNDSFLINASVRYLSLEPDVKITRAGSNSAYKAKDFKVNPWLWALNVGFRF